ncbi:MAG: DUF1854 domain-containing protein [Oscillospiraceae bacterium]|nr:DUF1854 domain-containing protein [Oscillospiraceae bacterium]
MPAQTQTATLADAIDIGFLDLAKSEFFITPGGFTGLRYKGAEHKRVSLRRALPIGSPGSYISVADHENKEIGIIKSIDALTGKQLEIVTAELGHRYYCPEISEIKSVKDKLGYVYMELTVIVDGKKHAKNCAVKDVNRNIRMLDSDRLIIFDVDGNRYLIHSLEALDKKSLKRLEPYLF